MDCGGRGDRTETCEVAEKLSRQVRGGWKRRKKVPGIDGSLSGRWQVSMAGDREDDRHHEKVPEQLPRIGGRCA